MIVMNFDQVDFFGYRDRFDFSTSDTSTPCFIQQQCLKWEKKRRVRPTSSLGLKEASSGFLANYMHVA